MTRTATIEKLAGLIAGIDLGRPVRVGIDGNSCSGKTRLADELIEPVRSHGRPVIRASMDGFHHPADFRRRQGADSPKGYYEDSFDMDAVKDCVLLPLGPDGNRNYQASQFDFRTESEAETGWEKAEANAVLIFEGVFLHRPELVPHWDFTVYVEVHPETTLQRALARDRDLFGSESLVRHKYENRYMPGQEMYREACDPFNTAHVVFDNNRIECPAMVIQRSFG